MSDQCETCQLKDRSCPIYPGSTGVCVEYRASPCRVFHLSYLKYDRENPRSVTPELTADTSTSLSTPPDTMSFNTK